MFDFIYAKQYNFVKEEMIKCFVKVKLTLNFKSIVMQTEKNSTKRTEYVFSGVKLDYNNSNNKRAKIVVFLIINKGLIEMKNNIKFVSALPKATYLGQVEKIFKDY